MSTDNGKTRIHPNRRVRTARNYVAIGEYARHGVVLQTTTDAHEQNNTGPLHYV